MDLVNALFGEQYAFGIRVLLLSLPVMAGVTPSYAPEVRPAHNEVYDMN
jgi:hypothetical protein